MPVSDNDLQVLEELLDGELAEAQTQVLRQRLAVEPELAAAMDRLRGDRQLRSRLFTLLEPLEQEVDVQVAQMRREIRREDIWASRVRGLRKITSVAAGIVLVFMAGWISRERLQVGPAAATPGGVAQNPVPLRPDSNLVTAGRGFESGRLRLATDAPGAADLSRVPVADDQRRQVYRIILQDPAGKLFVLQTFDPSMLPQRIPLNRLQIPIMPTPQLQPQPQGQGVLVNEQRPVAP
jgi:anti-sigma factor RsiW